MLKAFKALLSAFNAHRVRYLIVGGHAVSFHAQQRATKNIGILLDPAGDNSQSATASISRWPGLDAL